MAPCAEERSMVVVMPCMPAVTSMIVSAMSGAIRHGLRCIDPIYGKQELKWHLARNRRNDPNTGEVALDPSLHLCRAVGPGQINLVEDHEVGKTDLLEFQSDQVRSVSGNAAVVSDMCQPLNEFGSSCFLEVEVEVLAPFARVGLGLNVYADFFFVVMLRHGLLDVRGIVDA